MSSTEQQRDDGREFDVTARVYEAGTGVGGTWYRAPSVTVRAK